MKSSLIILLIGAVVAVACAAPSSKVSMQDDDGDKLAKKASWFNVAKRVVGGLNHAINGEKLALNQMNDDDLLSQALLDRMVSMQDDDDKVAKTAGWFNVAKRVVGGLNHAINGEELALNQMNDDDDDLLSQALLDRMVSMQDDDKVAKTAGWFNVAKRVVGGLNHAINGEKLALNQMNDDDDDDLLSQALLDRMVSMQDDDDKVAKTASWFNVAKRVVGGLNHAINGEKLALNQMNDDDDDDLLSQALLDHMVSMQDDDDKVAKIASWFNVAKRVVGGLNHAINGEKLALNQDDDEPGQSSV